jgi:hypothetical protein
MTKSVIRSEPLSINYMVNKENIYAYRETHREEYRKYMREYMRTYFHSLPKEVRYIRDKVMCIRNYLMGRVKNSKMLVEFMGITRKELAEKNSMTEEQFVEFVKTKTVNHIIPFRWLYENEPTLVPYFHDWHNLQFISKTETSTKHCSVDLNNPKVKQVLQHLRKRSTKIATP